MIDRQPCQHLQSSLLYQFSQHNDVLRTEFPDSEHETIRRLERHPGKKVCEPLSLKGGDVWFQGETSSKRYM